MKSLPVAFLIAVCLTLPGCGGDRAKKEAAAYKAACEGQPLRTAERRQKAMEDGYDINKNYDCIDKASFEAEKKRKAEWAAANTPEAKAERQAEFERRAAQERSRREAAERQAAEEAAAKPVVPPTLRPTDVNTATEAELANVFGVEAEGAAQIVAERKKGRFKSWADLVSRVAGLSAAQTAYYASVGGLTVDGQSLSGAAPDAALAAALKKRRER